MSLTRVYVETLPQVGETLWLNEQNSYHLAVVLRQRPPNQIIIFSGMHEEALAYITQVSQKKVQITVQRVYPICRESKLALHLAQVICKGDKMDWIVQKATELGVHTITPLFSAHMAYTYRSAQLEKKMMHWRAISIHAVAQCGRTVLPQFNSPVPLIDFLKHHQAQHRWILSPEGHSLPREINLEPITVLIGSEGGWSKEELRIAEQEGWSLISLGPRLLRAETASIAVLAILQYQVG